MAKVLYRQHRELNRFLQSANTISRTNYILILVLASVNSFATVAVNLTLFISTIMSWSEAGPVPFYSKWSSTHTYWEPISLTRVAMKSLGTYYFAIQIFQQWVSIALAIFIFALFGASANARMPYLHAICTLAKYFGRIPAGSELQGSPRSGLSSIRFGLRELPQDMTLASAELGCV